MIRGWFPGPRDVIEQEAKIVEDLRRSETIRRQWPRIHELVGLVASHQEKNHLGQLIQHQIFRGER